MKYFFIHFISFSFILRKGMGSSFQHQIKKLKIILFRYPLTSRPFSRNIRTSFYYTIDDTFLTYRQLRRIRLSFGFEATRKFNKSFAGVGYNYNLH